MAIINNISVYKGEAVTLSFTMSPVVDLTGWRIGLTVKNNQTDTGSIYTATTTSGSTGGAFSFNLPSTTTLTDLGVGVFAYDVQRTDTGNEAVLSIGNLTVAQEVRY
jgi:hypothetical protein